MKDKVKILQKRELEILKKLSELLDKHNIRYMLAYGSVLGCVRHQGFIPWDDDIDIFVWGCDLPKIKKIFQTEDTGYLKFHDFDTVDNYPYCFPKVIDSRTTLKEKEFKTVDYKCGVYIDIFPLFEISDNRIKRFFTEKLRYIRYGILRYYYMDSTHLNAGLKSLQLLIRTFFSANILQKQLYKSYIVPRSGQSLVAEPNIFAQRALVPTELFEKLRIMKFEDSQFPIPYDYNRYLTLVYGDYMQLPPEDKRVSEHNMIEITLDGKSLT